MRSLVWHFTPRNFENQLVPSRLLLRESEISIDYPSRSSQFYFLSVTLRWLHILPRLDAGNASDEEGAGGEAWEKTGEDGGGRGA